MNAAISPSRQTLPVWLGVAIWLVAFFSPAGCFLLVLIADGNHLSGSSVAIVSCLFLLTLVCAPVICGVVSWRMSTKNMVRIGWLTLTLLGMIIQLVFLALVLRAVLVAKIS